MIKNMPANHNKLIRQNLNLKVKAVDDQQYIIRGVFSTPATDRQGEIIDQKGWRLDEFMKNPVILFAHDQFTPAVGKAVELGIDEIGNLVGAIQFAVKEDLSGLAETLFNLYKNGFMRAFSVGFENHTTEFSAETDAVVLKENTLYEISCVNVPANALALAYSKGINLEPIKKAMEDIKTRGVVQFKPEATAPEGTQWDSNTVQVNVWGDGNNQANYARIHAWFDDTQNDDDGDGYPDVKSAYKLPHHDAKYRVVWRGVAAAMAALLGSRGGVALPEVDRTGVYNHLAKHYQQFDKEVPEIKTYTEMELKQIENNGNLSADNLAEKQSKVETPSKKGGYSNRDINRAIRQLIKAKRSSN